MGVEYHLVNKADYTSFELGKGPWYTELEGFQTTDHEALLPENDIQEKSATTIYRIANEVALVRAVRKVFAEAEVGEDYINSVVQKILIFCAGNQIHLVCDHDDTWHKIASDYKEVGTRYIEEETESTSNFTREKIVLRSTYWLTGISIAIFNALIPHLYPGQVFTEDDLCMPAPPKHIYQELAQKCGVSVRAIKLMAAGDYVGKLDTLVQVCVALGIAPEFSFKPIEHEFEQNLVAYYNQTNGNRRDN